MPLRRYWQKLKPRNRAVDTDIIQAIMVTAELCGTTFSPAAARLMCEDLRAYPKAEVLQALNACRKTARGRLTLADIIANLQAQDGRPGVEEAWALCPRDEAVTVCWTEEMAQAWGTAKPLLDAGDEVAARMAFKEVYTRIVAQSREHKLPVVWLMSLGHDQQGRHDAVRKAEQEGKIPVHYARQLLGHAAPPPSAPRLSSPAPAQEAIGGVLEHLGKTNRNNPVACEHLRKIRDTLGTASEPPKPAVQAAIDRQQVQATLNEMAREYYAKKEAEEAEKEAREECAAIQAEG